VTVSVSVPDLPSQGLVAGAFVGQLLFQSGSSSVTIPVSVVVGDAAFRQVHGIDFTKPFAGADPLPQTLTTSSTGTAFDFHVAAHTATGGDWLEVEGCGGYCNTPQAILIKVNPAASLAAGIYTG
jgi:hypothetical protein